jgi:hypothetical protein
MVQALPSSQPAPVLTAGAGQPLAGTQAPTLWHWSAPLQVLVLPPPHEPLDWQVSPVVQALASSHAAPVLTTQVAVAAAQDVQPPQADPEFCHAPFASHT